MKCRNNESLGDTGARVIVFLTTFPSTFSTTKQTQLTDTDTSSLHVLCLKKFILQRGKSERIWITKEGFLSFSLSLMAIATFSNFSSRALSFPTPTPHLSPPILSVTTRRITAASVLTPPQRIFDSRRYRLPTVVLAVGDGGSGGVPGGGGGGGGGGEDGDAEERNRTEAILALAEMGRSLDSLPKDLAAAVQAGRIPGAIVSRYFELEKSAVFRWLLQFGGFKERLLADDLFLAKVAMECGVGIFTKVCAF